MTRLLLAAATAAGLLASAAPAANACGLEYCPGTRIVCGSVDCSPSVVGCYQTEWFETCL